MPVVEWQDVAHLGYVCGSASWSRPAVSFSRVLQGALYLLHQGFQKQRAGEQGSEGWVLE